MTEISATKRLRIEAQGYTGLSDEDIAVVDPWLRMAPALCMVWTGIATYLQSALAILVLIPIALVGALMPGHPFEVVYNHGIRHITRTRKLPAARAPRRFACGVASVWLAATYWAFQSGSPVTGQILGYSFVAVAAFPTCTGFCIPSFVYGRLLGKQ